METPEFKNVKTSRNSNLITYAIVFGILLVGFAASFLAFIKLRRVEDRNIAKHLNLGLF